MKQLILLNSKKMETMLITELLRIQIMTYKDQLLKPVFIKELLSNQIPSIDQIINSFCSENGLVSTHQSTQSFLKFNFSAYKKAIIFSAHTRAF